MTGDLWEYAALDSVRRLTDEAAKKIDKKISDKAQDAAREAAGLPAGTTTTTTKVDKTDEETFQDVKNILVPSTSDVLYGLIDGSVVSSTWNTLTGKTDQLFSYVLRRTGDSVGGTLGDFLNYLGEGATYVCYSGGKQVAYSTATKYPVIAGGIAIGRSADGKAINRMLQLSPVVIDKLGAASVMSGDKRYETADDMQVYLWSNGQYFATSLPKINTEDYKLIAGTTTSAAPEERRSVSLWPSRRTEPEIFQSQNSSLAADEAGLLFYSLICHTPYFVLQ